MRLDPLVVLSFSRCGAWASWAVTLRNWSRSGRQLVVRHLGLLPRLGQERAHFLIVAVQGGGPILELLVLPRRVACCCSNWVTLPCSTIGLLAQPVTHQGDAQPRP